MLSALPQIAAKLVEPARWLLVIGIAYTLATTALYFLSAPQTEPTLNKPDAPTTGTRRSEPIENIIGRNLFGVADAAAIQTEQSERAVETRLPLELHGVFVADSDDASAAIVAQKGKPGLLYSVGDTLPGNARLIEVHTDHIVLRRSGARETLTFPEAKGARLMASDRRQTKPSKAKPTDAAATASPKEIIASYRSMIDEDPNKALSALGVSPVGSGASEGYRVSALAESPYLSQTGLQPGDVILSVNGRPVGDISQDRMEIDNVLAQGSARLEVQRGTRRFFVTASL
jgi:general secretion pathway protein C